MKVKKAKYSGFRNLSNVKVEFSPEVNVLWGMNAQGKSNILEGIYYFARGRSFRGVRDRDLIMFGAGHADFELEFTRGTSETKVTLTAQIPSVGKKKLLRNGAPLRGSAEMLGAFRAVLFCPAHLSIIDGGPGERRAFLDIAIAQTSQSYVYYLSNYRRFLTERNALLKRYASGIKVTPEEWETYAEQLSLAAARIHSERKRYCAEMTGDVVEYFREMTSGREEPCLRYVTHMGASDDPEAEEFDCAATLKQKLTQNIEREAAAGATLWGPHKDDISVTVNGKEARLFASQGQRRSIALAMKLAEGEISRRLTGEYPVFLLDDVFSELDADRRSFIMEKLRGRQIIVTSCEPTVIPEGTASGDVAYFEVSEGQVL